MINYEELYLIAKEKLSDERFKHSEAVVKRAIEYAKIYGVDEKTAKITAIAHDIAKELTAEEEAFYIKKYNIKLDEIEKQNHSLVHAKIGAVICQKEYGFSLDMANSVKYHTTGKENMTILEKIIYLADATDETREYDYEPYVKIIKNDIDKGIVEITKKTIKHLLETGKMIHLDSIKCYNYYLKNSQ